MSEHISDVDFGKIIFMGIELPRYAVYLDIAGQLIRERDNVGHLIRNNPNHEEIVNWFWKFAICFGRQREDKSDLICDFSGKLRMALINVNINDIDGVFPYDYRLDDDVRMKMLTDWIKSVEIIEGVSKFCVSNLIDKCTWYGTDPRLV